MLTLDGPARAAWEQRQIDDEIRRGAIREVQEHVAERFERTAVTVWFVGRMQAGRKTLKSGAGDRT